MTNKRIKPTREEVLKKIKLLEFPTINKLAISLGTPRQYVSVLLGSLEAEGLIQSEQIGSGKIWKVAKND